MHCSKCGVEVSQDANFCQKCGTSLNPISSASGEGSVNVAGSNNISNSHFHVGDVYQAEKPEDTAYIDRTSVRKIKFGDTPVKTSWLIVSGLVGFVGSWASILSFFGSNWQFLSIVILALSMFLVLTGVILWRTRFVRMKFFNVEANPDGELFFTRIGGECPKCDGKLKLVDIKVSQNSHRTYVRCTRNGDHIWNFDPTVLG